MQTLLISLSAYFALVYFLPGLADTWTKKRWLMHMVSFLATVTTLTFLLFHHARHCGLTLEDILHKSLQGIVKKNKKLHTSYILLSSRVCMFKETFKIPGGF